MVIRAGMFIRIYGMLPKPSKACTWFVMHIIHCGNCVRSITLKPSQRYFHETLYKYKALLDSVQRTRAVTPPTFFTTLCLFENFEMESVSAQ